jgi:HEAT repeat protein
MSCSTRFLTRRWLLAFLGLAALLFGVAMLHPYPRQSLFGPTIRGEPWCVWEAAVRRFAHENDLEQTWTDKTMRWMGVEQKIDPDDLFNHAEMLPLLLELAEDPDHRVRERVLSTFFWADQLRDQSALPVLRRRLQDPKSDCRVNAASAIRGIDLKEPVDDVLLRILEDRNDPHRHHAIQVLANRSERNTELFGHLARYAVDEDKEIRQVTMIYLQFDGVKALPILRRGVDDKEVNVRYAAIHSLSALGPSAKETVPALVRRLKDDDATVRAAAVEALVAIEPERFQHLKAERKIE